jgi:hypothetical protein
VNFADTEDGVDEKYATLRAVLVRKDQDASGLHIAVLPAWTSLQIGRLAVRVQPRFGPDIGIFVGSIPRIDPDGPRPFPLAIPSDGIASALTLLARRVYDKIVRRWDC